MSHLEKLNYFGLNQAILDENQFDNTTKEFVDSLFGTNALDVIKYKYPKLNQNLNELTNHYQKLGLDSNLDEIDFKVEIAKTAYKLTNLDKKKIEIKESENNLRQLNDAKKRLINKKENLSRIQKKGDVIDGLKADVEKVKNEFKEFYNKAKATEKILEDIGFRSIYSIESMDKIRDDINNVKSRIENLEEFTQPFDGINSESELKSKINHLNEELKNYKDFFIKPEEEN